MSETSRRGFLSGGLRAAVATAGGVLLPMKVGTALAFPNLDAIPNIPVLARGFGPSAELLELRQIIARQWESQRLGLGREGYPAGHRGGIWMECQNEYARVACEILDRPERTWSNVAEIAEVCWRAHPKVWYGQRPGETFGMLSLDGYQRHGPYVDRHSPDLRTHSTASLIEAVLGMTGGERRDPAWSPGEPVLSRRLSSEELDELCALSKRPGGAHG